MNNSELYEMPPDGMLLSERRATLHDALVGFISASHILDSFNTHIKHVPDEYRDQYFHRLAEYHRASNDVQAGGIIGGMLNELRLIGTVMQDGQEQVDFAVGAAIGKITYMGYGRDSDLKSAPDKEMCSMIDSDIPIVRGDKPYVFETKSAMRTIYGSKPADRNQVLKYQTAINIGKLAGATVAIKGQVDPDFVVWALGIDAHSTIIPDVEIRYVLELPSQRSYSVILKPGTEGNGLRYQNAELTQEQDIKVAADFDIASANGSLIDILTSPDLPLAETATAAEYKKHRRKFYQYIYRRLKV